MDAGRKSVEHGIGRIVHRAAKLVKIPAEAFGMVVVGPQNAARGKRAIARTGRIRALLENDARRPIALLGDGDRRGHAGKAAAHDENVGLFVPRDILDRLSVVVLVGRLRRASAETCRGDAGNKRGACRLDERTTALRKVERRAVIHGTLL